MTANKPLKPENIKTVRAKKNGGEPVVFTVGVEDIEPMNITGEQTLQEKQKAALDAIKNRDRAGDSLSPYAARMLDQVLEGLSTGGPLPDQFGSIRLKKQPGSLDDTDSHIPIPKEVLSGMVGVAVSKARDQETERKQILLWEFFKIKESARPHMDYETLCTIARNRLKRMESEEFQERIFQAGHDLTRKKPAPMTEEQMEFASEGIFHDLGLKDKPPKDMGNIIRQIRKGRKKT